MTLADVVIQVEEHQMVRVNLVATVIPQAVEAAISRVVSPDEMRVALESTIPAEEREEVLELVRWFTTRYARGEARLAYVRQAVARCQRAHATRGRG